MNQPLTLAGCIHVTLPSCTDVFGRSFGKRVLVKRDVKSSGFVMYSNSTFINFRKGLKVMFFLIFHRHVSCDVQ